MLTSKEWWTVTRQDPQKMEHWLQHQYLGELSAVHLISTILLKFSHEATPQERRQLLRVLQQELTHAEMISTIMGYTDITPISDTGVSHKYWNEVLPGVDNFKKALQASASAEQMRLYRIQAIVEDPETEHRIKTFFTQILKDETWHAKIFKEMQGDFYDPELDVAHEKGLSALNLVLA